MTNNDPFFRTARKNRVFQDVVDQIQEAVLTGKLKAGDTLPAEREMKEIFQTSRGTLREALRVLEQKGLIEIRMGTGGGSVVRNVTTEQLSENLALLIRSGKISLDHLGEFREGVEGNVAALAAERAEKKDILHLKEMLEKAGACIAGGSAFRNDFLEVDKQIHMDLARITGNPVYMYVLHTVHDNIYRYFDRYLSMDRQELEENYQDLCDMVAAVEKGDADGAKSLARRHVRRFSHYMQQRAQREIQGSEAGPGPFHP